MPRTQGDTVTGEASAGGRLRACTAGFCGAARNIS